MSAPHARPKARVNSRRDSVVGSYLLGEVLGRGGMGVVHRATVIETGEGVALKLMASDIADSDEFRARFLREGAVGPHIDHPNVVPILECGEANGELYIAMKLIEGSNLKEILKQEGPLAPRRALRIFRQIAAALDAAHESGLVHRDIKPQNILLTTDEAGNDVAYVSDFGLVKPKSSETSASRTGQVFGSLPYMAPEQIEAMEMDGRADVYALACVVFEALTGRPPFERPNEVAVVWAHVHEDPPVVTSFRKELPGGIDAVVMQAMSKHPDDRYLTCGEFIDSFEQGLGRGRSSVRRAMRPLVARASRPKTEREVWGPNFFPELSRVRKVQRDVNWFKVGAFVTAFVMLASIQTARKGGIPGAVGAVARGVSKIGRGLINGPAADQGPRAKDPRSHTRANELSPAKPSSQLRKTLLATDSGHLALPPDDVSHAPVQYDNPALEALTIVFTSTRDKRGTNQGMYPERGEIYMMNGNGTDHRRITSTSAVTYNLEADMSPSGDIVFESDRTGNFELYVMERDGGSVRRLTTSPDCEFGPRWSPDGTRILYTTGPPGPILCGVGEYSLWSLDVDTGTTQVVARNSGYAGSGAWSPDGRRIVYETISDSGGYDVWIARSDGTRRRPLIATAQEENSPDWSPDGKKVIFSRNGAVVVMDLSSRRKKQLTQTASCRTGGIPPCSDSGARWSPDGSKILFTTGREGHWQLYIMDADGSNETNIAPHEARQFFGGWQVPASRTAYAIVAGGQIMGRVQSPFDSCVSYQPVRIQRRTKGAWRNIQTVTTSSTGEFSADPSASGITRFFVPFTFSRLGIPCALTSARV